MKRARARRQRLWLCMQFVQSSLSVTPDADAEPSVSRHVFAPFGRPRARHGASTTRLGKENWCFDFRPFLFKQITVYRRRVSANDYMEIHLVRKRDKQMGKRPLEALILLPVKRQLWRIQYNLWKPSSRILTFGDSLSTLNFGTCQLGFIIFFIDTA